MNFAPKKICDLSRIAIILCRVFVCQVQQLLLLSLSWHCWSFLFTSYVKSPPDKAYIISGLRKTPKILIGKAGLKLPFFERKDELLIKQISIDIKTDDYVPTLDFIGVNIDAVAKVKIVRMKKVCNLP